MEEKEFVRIAVSPAIRQKVREKVEVETFGKMEEITPEDWEQLQKTYDENEDIEPKYTKQDLFEAYKQSAIDGGWKDDDFELELFFEKWFKTKYYVPRA